jgi:hypothetical protein
MKPAFRLVFFYFSGSYQHTVAIRFIFHTDADLLLFMGNTLQGQQGNTLQG